MYICAFSKIIKNNITQLHVITLYTYTIYMYDSLLRRSQVGRRFYALGLSVSLFFDMAENCFFVELGTHGSTTPTHLLSTRYMSIFIAHSKKGTKKAGD